MIKLENVSKSYGERAVLSDFSLSVADGERVCIVGASGCGKTTLLRIIAGLTVADGGSVSVTGASALMFQEPRLLPWRNALDNILAVLNKENFALADKYLCAAGLAAEKEKMPDELSGGMAQRVAFARFLAYAEATDADVLLIDEPFSALDCNTASAMLSLLDSFTAGKTLILVTHDDTHAEKLGARVIKI